MRGAFQLEQASRDELNTLLVDAALAAIEKDAPLAQIEEALRALSELTAKADPMSHVQSG